MTRYEAVVFDLDGTLMDVTGLGRQRYLATVESVLDQVGLPIEQSMCELFLGQVDIPELREHCHTFEVDFNSVWDVWTCAECDLQQTAITAGILQPYNDTLVLPDLTERVTLAVLSDNYQAIVEHFLEYTQIATWFDYIDGREPTVEGLSRRKPNPSRLQTVFNELGVAAENTLYVGDSTVDATVAERAGCIGALVQRSHPWTKPVPPPDSPGEPTHVIDSLEEILQIVAPEN